MFLLRGRDANGKRDLIDKSGQPYPHNAGGLQEGPQPGLVQIVVVVRLLLLWLWL